ncbi:hypothetical protein [Kaarinaea lacus]
MKVKNKTKLELPFLFMLVASSLILFLPSCASQTTSNEEATADVADATEATPSTASALASESSSETSAKQSSEPSQPTDVISPVQLVEIGESCKQQPYVEYEKQAREHIQRGWEATQAQRFGVGFRDTSEYEKWKATHNTLFTKVSNICGQLSDCVKQNTADKEQKCATELQRFEQWQALAKRFVDKVKVVERSQPPMLCSLTPSVDDPSQCYALLADQIEKTCQAPSCSEAASCFHGVYFLDDAINQAKLACSFVGQKLSQCRGYTEATARRKAEVEQCIDTYNQIQVEILPVI